MYDYYLNRRAEFLKRYHKRSNIESTFSMVKRKFGNNLKTKTLTGNTNEILCKAICHNIVVLIHEMNELGINPALLWGTNEVLEIAKNLIDNQKNIN